MSDRAYVIRNYAPEDFDTLVQLGSDVEKLEQSCRRSLVNDFIENLGLPNHFPENNLFLAQIGGAIVGYADAIPELNIRRVVLSCLVHPQHRMKGLAKRLVECAILRATELGARIVHTNVPQDSVTSKRLFSKMGFRFVRRFLDLSLDLSKANVPRINEIAAPCRHLRSGEEDKLVEIQNRSFGNTWGYHPNTIAEVIYRITLPNSSPEDVLLACDADRPTGYCWTRREFGGERAGNGDKGRIYMIGVDPDHRGKGVGRHVLLAGLSHLKSKGIRVVELTVDSKNRAACALYRSVGFEVSTRSLWYEKVLT